jgi:type IV pilus assembly protein PilV
MELKRIGEGKTVEAGFTLVEVLIAIFLLTVGILGMASMQVMALQGNSFAGNISESNALCQYKIEELMALPYDHADLEDLNADATPTSYTDPSPPDGYVITWEVDADNPVPDTKEIEVKVAWIQKGQNKETVFTSYKSKY